MVDIKGLAGSPITGMGLSASMWEDASSTCSSSSRECAVQISHLRLHHQIIKALGTNPMSATEHLLKFPSLLEDLSDPPEEDSSCRHGTSLRRGGGSCSCTHLPQLVSAMLQEINGWICQEDIKEDNKRPFLANTFFRQTKCLRCIGEEAVSSTGHNRGTWQYGVLEHRCPMWRETQFAL